MAYSNTDNKYLRKVLDLGGDIGGSVWCLDTIDAETAVDAAGYITDGKAQGFRKGDLVINRRWTTTLPLLDSELTTAVGSANIIISVFLHVVVGVDPTTLLPNLSNGIAITITDSD